MALEPGLARRLRYLRLLRASLVAGAAYDAGFAIAMVVAPEIPARWLSLPLPGERFYLWLPAVLLAMLAALYLFAAHDPRRYGPVVGVAIAGRAAGAVVFLLAARGRPELAGLHALAAADGLFALAHAAGFAGLRR